MAAPHHLVVGIIEHHMCIRAMYPVEHALMRRSNSEGHAVRCMDTATPHSSQEMAGFAVGQ